MIKFLILLCCFFVTVKMEITCYDCEPTDSGECKSPARDNVKITNCIGNHENECFSFYYVPRLRSLRVTVKGVYRGCVDRNSNYSNTCDYLKALLTSGDISGCTTCSKDKCNGEAVAVSS